MNYKKIGKELKSLGYIDDRMLMCHSNSTVASSKNYGLFMKIETISQKLPYFMILSINGDKLNISKAKTFGGYKEYFANIDLKSLKFHSKTTINYVTASYKFLVTDEDNNVIGEFYINATEKKDEAAKLVDYIIKYNA